MKDLVIEMFHAGWDSNIGMAYGSEDYTDAFICTWNSYVKSCDDGYEHKALLLSIDPVDYCIKQGCWEIPEDYYKHD